MNMDLTKAELITAMEFMAVSDLRETMAQPDAPKWAIKMLTDEFHRRIWTIATQEAVWAINRLGPEDVNAPNCGFAWVTVHPANHPFARWAKAQGLGRPGDTTGWTFWKPGAFGGQQIDHHRAGANAFARVLAFANIRAEVGSRYD